MHRIHNGFTVVAAVKKCHSEQLRILLNTLSREENNNSINFDKSETTLFVSAVIIPQQDELPESFVFATSYSGPFDVHLRDLICSCESGLSEIFSHCVGFPKEKTSLADYLKSHKYPSTFTSRLQIYFVH